MNETIHNAHIIPTESADFETICWLFEQARVFQQEKNYNVWNGYDQNVIRRDIANRIQFKITDGQLVAGIFTICPDDPVIWGARDRGDALYLHRVVGSPHYRGRKQFAQILDFTVAYARARGIRLIRLDTWGDNQKIIAYYEGFGFRFVENVTTPDSPELAVQQRGLLLALLEYIID